VITTSAKTWTVTVDGRQTFAQMIEAGAYDHVNSQITEASFPVDPGDVAARELILLCLGEVSSTDMVLHELDNLGLRSGRIEDLLAFGATYPETQRTFPIVALGSIETSYRRRPFLWGSPRVRHLDLRFDEKIWGGNIRFLTLRI
jgi:hypothetical protein